MALIAVFEKVEDSSPSFTSMPVSALNFTAMSFSAGERSASTHMVMVVDPQAARSAAVGAAVLVVLVSPPQALSAGTPTADSAPTAKTRRLTGVALVFGNFIGVLFFLSPSPLWRRVRAKNNISGPPHRGQAISKVHESVSKMKVDLSIFRVQFVAFLSIGRYLDAQSCPP